MRFFRTFLVSLLAVSAVYLGTVTIVNPRGDFAGTRFPWLYANTRKQKQTLFGKYAGERPVELLLLGSSRTMLLDPVQVESISGLRAFNFGVFSAAPEDFLAAYRWLRETHGAPRALLIGVDLDALGAGTAASDELLSNRTLAAELDPSLRQPFAAALHELRLYKQTLTVVYARDVLGSLRLSIRPSEPLNRFRANGAMEYPGWDRAISAGTFDRAGAWNACAGGAMNQLKASLTDGVSAGRLRQLETLLQEAHRDSVLAVVWTTPVHPALLSRTRTQPALWRSAEEARQRLAAVAANNSVPFVDLSDPSTFGGDPDQWYDCQHYHRADAAKIVRRLLDALPLVSTSLR